MKANTTILKDQIMMILPKKFNIMGKMSIIDKLRFLFFGKINVKNTQIIIFEGALVTTLTKKTPPVKAKEPINLHNFNKKSN